MARPLSLPYKVALPCLDRRLKVGRIMFRKRNRHFDFSLSFPLWRQSRRPTTPTSSPPPPLRQSGDISRSRCICIPRSDGRREEFVHQIPSASGSKDLSGYPGPSCDGQAKYVQLFMFSPVKKVVEALFCPSIQRIKDPNEVPMVAGTTTALRRKTSRRGARHPFGHEIRSVLQLSRS